MGERRWVLLVLTVVAVVAFIAYYGWRAGGASQRLHNLVVQAARPALGDGFSLGRVEVGFGAIHLRDVVVDRGSFVLRAEEVRVGFSLVRLLLGRLESAHMGGDALLLNPHLTIRTKGAKQLAAQDASTSPVSGERPIMWFKRVTITGGQIALADSVGRVLMVARGLEGVAVADAGERASLHLSGRLFSSRLRSLQANGQLNLRTLALEGAELTLLKHDVSKLPPLAKGKVLVRRGSLEGVVRLHSDQDVPYGIALTGTLHLRDGEAEVRGHVVAVEEVSLQLHTSLNGLEVQLEGRLPDDAELAVRGHIRQLMRPRLELAISVRRLDLATFGPLAAVTAKGRLVGSAAMEAELRGPLDSLQATGWASVPLLKLNGVVARQLQLGFSYVDSLLFVHRCNLRAFGNAITGSGTLAFSRGGTRLRARFKGEGDVAAELNRLLATEVASCPDTFEVDLGGSAAAPFLRGRFQLALADELGEAGVIRSTIAYGRGRLEVDAEGTGGLQVRGWVDNGHLFAEGRNLQRPAVLLWKLPARESLRRRLECDVVLQGPRDSLLTAVEGRWRDDNDLLHPLLSANGLLTSTKRGQAWRSTLRLFRVYGPPLDGQVELHVRRGTVELSRLTLNEVAAADLKIEGQKVLGRLRLRGAPLEEVMFWADSSATGQLNGEVAVSGTVASPRTEGTLMLTNGYFHGQGPFTVSAAFQGQDSLLFLRQLTVEYSGEQIARAEGTFGPGRQIRALNLTGEDLPLDKLFAAATGQTDVVQGVANLHLAASGGPDSLMVAGQAQVVQGHILGVAFDTLGVVLAGRPEAVPEEASRRPYVGLQSLRLVRQGLFALQAEGAVPVHLEDTLVVHITGRGDLLALLDQASPFVKEAKSNASLRLRVGGPLARPRIEEGELTLEEGRLRCASVLPTVKELRGVLRLRQGSRFVELSELRGLMGGEPFVLYNVPAVGKEYRRPLQPLVLDELGVSLGILVVETSPDGVVLSFPGLMESGEYGRFQLLGQGRSDHFCLSGPIERPVIYGTMVLHGVQFGYPFNPGGETIGRQESQILNGVEWDLRVVPGTNTRYVKRLPGGVDHVYVTLDLDERYGGLHFTGQLQDESFRIEGELKSTRGTVEYLDLNFRLEQAGIEFDRNTLVPVVYGKAYTTVADSNGIPSQIYLTLATVDHSLEGRRVDERVLIQRYRARWDELRFQLSSDNAALGGTEAQLLASLGYTPERLRQKTVDVIGISADNLVFRPLLRPFERRLERTLGLDMVRLSSRLTRNFIEMNLATGTPLLSKLYLLRSTRLTVGKYLSEELYLVYTGQLESGLDYRYQLPGLGLHHTLGLELRINPKLLLEMEYDYDGLLLWRKDDTRIWIRHWFPF